MRIICFGFGLAALAAVAGATVVASAEDGLMDRARTRWEQRAAHNDVQNLSSFGEDFDSDKALKTSQAAIGRTLSGYTFHDRQGRLVRLSDYRDKPFVISLIFTSCYHICPTTTRNLAHAAKVARSAVGRDKFAVVTIGFDARNDTPERMTGYARQQGVGSKSHWSFLSADRATIERLMEDLGFIYTPSSKGFDHLIQTTVVDKDGKIYGQIYGMDFDPGFLTEAIRGLVFGRSLSSLSLSALVNKVRLYCTLYDPASDTYKLNYGMVFGMLSGVVGSFVLGIVVIRFLRKS